MLRSLLQAGEFDRLTSFFSLQYLALFLPLVVLAYGITPRKVRRYVLLFASFGFFWLISRRFLVFLFMTILSVWGFGLLLGHMNGLRDKEVKAAERPQRKAIKKKWQLRSRWVLAGAVVLNIGTLLVLKYSHFFVTNVNALFGTDFFAPYFLILPIGISFYTLQAVSYLFDVYRGLIPADRNLARVALFISFFPQIVEGPICRYSQTADSLWEARPITWENLMLGIQRIGYGLMKKLVVADRLNSLIEEVFSNYGSHHGGIIALAALCYTIQLYMDFSGAMDAVTGTAQIFGVTMPENFRQPFFSKTISEFWSRWHISLGTWFKDHIFYPVTMSTPMKNLTTAARKRIGNHFGPLVAGSVALFCVWFCNGLWHGAAWSYIFFGMYHFVLILIGNLMAPAAKWFHTTLRISPENRVFKGFQILRTCVLVVIGELFFRANTLTDGLAMFGKMITDFRFDPIDEVVLFNLGLNARDFWIVVITLTIVLAVSILKERNVGIRQALAKQPVAIRWIVFYALIFYIITFGAYGVGYIPVNPMYANF